MRLLHVSLLASLVVAVCARSAAALPDLTPEVSDVSVFVSDVEPGDVAEGCATGTTARRLVRFTLKTRNLGPDDLVLGSPGCPDCTTQSGDVCANPLFFCSAAHGHAHLRSFVRPEILDANGTVVAAGNKFGFCMEDSECADPKYTCENQGLTAGCADVYPAGIQCQYVDITDARLPSGTYTLRVTIDPQNAIPEADETNNVVEVPVQVGAPPPTCPVYVARDLPRDIPDLGSASSTVTVPLAGPVTSVRLIGLRGTHSFLSDLEVHLRSPAGTDAVVMNRACGTDHDFNVDLDDGACSDLACPPTDGLAHRPSAPLAIFAGEEAAGTWTLEIFDRAEGDVGTLEGWGLEICVPGAGCAVYHPTDLPMSIADLGVATSTLVAPPAQITDVNVLGLRGTHTFLSDLEVHLTSPAGTDVIVMNRACGTDHDFSLDLDDSACGDISCPATDGLPHRPSESLSAFIGESAAGTWALRVFDRAEGDVGTLDDWALQICSCGNGIVDPGEECDDGNTRSGDCCSATCQRELVCPACEACDSTTLSCVPAPRAFCHEPAVPGAARLLLRAGLTTERNLLVWKWLHGDATSAAELGDPTLGDDYALCVYEGPLVEPTLLLRSEATGGSTCGAVPCWKGLGSPVGAKGFRYVDRRRPADGLRSMTLRPGAAGAAKALVNGTGLVLPTLPVTPPLTVQLHGPGRSCWEARYPASGITRNDARHLKGRSE